MFEHISVPTFARINEYAGAWAIDPLSASNLLALVKTMDFPRHMAAYNAAPPPSRPMEKASLPSGGSIAILSVQGLLMKQETSLGGTSTIRLRRELRQAVGDNDVRGILLAVDSPGGTVSGTDDLAREVQEAKKKKPVWCQIEDLGCSAAYWIASQASRVTANSPTALVGSIGTIQVIQDLSEAAAKEGIKTLVFATGHLKGLGTPGTRVTDDQIAHVQGLVNAVQESFDGAVKMGRGMSDGDLQSARHGGAMTATEAKQKKLIDGISTMSATLKDFARHIAGGGVSLVGKPPMAGTLPMLPTPPRGLPMRTAFPGVQPLASLPPAFMADREYGTFVEAGKLVAELKATGDPADWPALDRAERIHRQLQTDIWNRVGSGN